MHGRLRIIQIFQVDSSAISHREGNSPIRRGFDIFNERGRLNSMGIATDRGYAIIIRHRFAGVTVRFPRFKPRLHALRTYPPKFRVPPSSSPSAHSARMQFRSQTRTAAMGDARGGEAVQSVAMATYRHWTPFTPHFTYVLSPCTVIRRPDNIVPCRAKNTGLLLRS